LIYTENSIKSPAETEKRILALAGEGGGWLWSKAGGSGGQRLLANHIRKSFPGLNKAVALLVRSLEWLLPLKLMRVGGLKDKRPMGKRRRKSDHSAAEVKFL
jgi:hypothetical protein